MAFNTRRGIGIFGRDEEESKFDPNNPFGESPPEGPQRNPFWNFKQQPDPTTQPFWGGPQPQPMPPQPQPVQMPVGMPQPQTQPVQRPIGGPNAPPQGNPVQMPIGGPGAPPQGNPVQRPIGRPVPQMNEYEGSIMREGEINRGYDKQRDNPYSDTNFYKPGGLGDQMRGKEYADNDNMMDDILKRPRGSRGVTREIPASWSNMDLPDRDGTEPYRVRNFRNDFDTTPRPMPHPGRGWDRFDRDTDPTLELQTARKKGINPVPWSRRNRALE